MFDKIHLISKRTIIFIGIIVCIPSISFADSAEVGAAYQCENDMFSIYGTVESTGGDISAPPNMEKLNAGIHNLKCEVNGSNIEAVIYLTGPGHNGMCGAPGTIDITLSVNGKNVIGGEYILNYCLGTPTISNIEISPSEDGLKISICKGLWDWSDSIKNQKCEVTYLEEQKPTPSFNCEKASSKIEKMICASPYLSKLDNELGKAYSQKLKESPDKVSFIQQQRDWLKERNKCADETCLKQAYENRMEKLSSKTH